MTRAIFLLMSGLCCLLMFGNFQCEQHYCSLEFELRNWHSVWLNNSGIEPITSSDPIPRSALGIRLSAAFLNPDSLSVSENEACSWQAFHPISQLEIFATNGFDTIANGDNISSRFRLRALNAYSFQYLTLEQALGPVNFFYAPVTPDYEIDLVMIEPPSQSGAYQFSVKITYDSLSMPPSPDTFFTLPTVILQ